MVAKAGLRSNPVTVRTQLDAQLLPLLFQNLERLREENKEDSDGIHTTLGMHK
jgi:hypothetical protein